MSSEGYAVVRFDDDTVEAIPRQWITTDGMCWWPIQKVNQAIQKMVAPDPLTWRKHHINVLKLKGMIVF